MYAGQPLSLKMLLPEWLGVEDFYTGLAAFAAFAAVMAVGLSFIQRDHQAKRVRMLKERRAVLRGEASRTKRRSRPETGVNTMRRVVNQFHLLKSSQVSQVQAMLNEAAFRSKDAIVIYMLLHAYPADHWRGGGLASDGAGCAGQRQDGAV